MSLICKVRCCWTICRQYSKRTGGYKQVKTRRQAPVEIKGNDSEGLAWRDPNFELLASKEFPLILPGNVGIAWYDSQTTLKSPQELVMERIDESAIKLEEEQILCQIQACPTVLRKAVCDLFPYHPLEHSELSIITITLRADLQEDVATDRMAQTFLLAAKNVCDKLKAGGYWADFINPFSGRPYLFPNSGGKLYESDERFRCLDFQILDVKDCKVISNEDAKDNKRFIGSLFTDAPSKKTHLLNSVFLKAPKQ